MNKLAMNGKNRRYRRWCLWMAMLLAVCALGSGAVALAERNGSSVDLDIQSVSVNKDGSIDMLLYSKSDNLSADDLTLSAGDVEIPIESVVPYTGKTSWIILVDSANVNTDSGIEPVRATMKDLLENMRNDDNGTILSIADALNFISLRDKALLMSSEPPTIKKDTSEPRLNEAIDKVLTFLETSNEAHEHAVLTIITNGKSINELGMSSTSLIQRISNGVTTIYPVVYNTESSNNNQTQEKLYRMAEVSCGGIYLNERADSGNDGAMRLVNSISNNEAHFYRMVAQGATTGAQGSDLTLRTTKGQAEAGWTLDADGTARLSAASDSTSDASEEDSDTNDEDSDIKVEKKEPEVTEKATATATAKATETVTATQTEAATAEATATATAEPTATATASPGVFSFPPSTMAGYVVYGLIAITVIAVILLIVLNKKKKDDDGGDDTSSNKTMVITSPVNVMNMNRGLSDDQRQPFQYYSNEICVTLVDVDNPRISYTGYMKQNELSMGRGGVDDRGRPVVVDVRMDTDDPKLSRKHVVFQMKDGRMMVNDCSTNGIYIDDFTKRIVKPTEIHQKSILKMGSARYMVTWSVERAPYSQGGR